MAGKVKSATRRNELAKHASGGNHPWRRYPALKTANARKQWKKPL